MILFHYPLSSTFKNIVQSHITYPQYCFQLLISKKMLCIVLLVQLFWVASPWCFKNSIKLADDVEQVDFSPDGQFFVVGLSNRQVNVHYTSNNSVKCTYTDTISINVLKFYPNSSAFIVGLDSPSVRVRTTTDCSNIATFNTGHYNVYGIDFDSTGTKILTCGSDQKFNIWSFAFSLLGGGFQTGSKIWSCDFSFDDYVITGDEASTVKIYSTTYANPAIYTKVLNAGGVVWSVSFKGGSHTEYVAGDDIKAYVDNQTSSLVTMSSKVSVALYDGLTDHFLMVGDDIVRIYEQSNHSNFQKFTQPTDNILSADFTDDSMILAIGSKDQYLYLYSRCVSCFAPANTTNSNYCSVNVTNTTNSSTNSSTNTTTNTTSNTTANSTAINTTNATNITSNTTTSNTTSNSTNNSTNSSSWGTNSTNGSNFNCSNIGNCSNSTNITHYMNQLPVQQFFTQFLDQSMRDYLQHSDLQSSIEATQQCNHFIIKIAVPQKQCPLYLDRKEYIFIHHQNISKRNSFCSHQTRKNLNILVEITGSINQSQLQVTIPKQTSLQIAPPLPLSQWHTLLQEINVKTESLLYLQYQFPAQCQASRFNGQLVTVMLYLSAFILFFGIFSSKITGLQLFGVLQLSYFDLANHGYVNVILFPLTKFYLTNGVKLEFQREQSNNLPNLFNQMHINSQFLNNFNLMLIIYVALMVFVFLIFIKGVISKQQKFRYWGRRIFYQATITFILFSIFNVSFSSGIHIKYSSAQSQNRMFHVFSSFIMYVCLILIFFMVFRILFTRERYLGQFKDKFKQNFVCYLYISIQILYRAIIGFLISYHHDYQQIVLVVLGFPLFFTMFTAINLPFKSVIHNYRAIVIRISEIIILWTANYYRSMKSNTAKEVRAHLTTQCYIQIGVIFICLIFSLVVMIYELVTWIKFLIKKEHQKEKILPVQIVKINQAIQKELQTNRIFIQQLDNKLMLMKEEIEAVKSGYGNVVQFLSVISGENSTQILSRVSRVEQQLKKLNLKKQYGRSKLNKKDFGGRRKLKCKYGKSCWRLNQQQGCPFYHQFIEKKAEVGQVAAGRLSQKVPSKEPIERNKQPKLISQWNRRVLCTAQIYNMVTANNLKVPRKDGIMKKISFRHRKPLIKQLMRRKCIIDSKGILVNEEVFFRATARGASNGL